MKPLQKSITTLNAVAQGVKKADLLLHDASLVSVYTNEILKHQDVAVSGQRIAYVGPDGSHTRGQDTKVINLKGKYLTPGFADPHTHIDQFVMPSELAKKSLLHGTTSLFSDPIDIVSVAGYRGFAEFLRLTENLPARFFHVVPGGLPVDKKFSHGKSLTHAQEKSAICHPDVLGLGEVFSWIKVTMRDPKTMKSLSAMLEADCIINGHTAGASAKKLNSYVSSGILSCHEPIDFDQVLERLRLGMWIMMREGSIRRDLVNIIPRLLSHPTHFDRLMFCSDGLDPTDITKFGHIDHCVREAVRLGITPVDAVTMASKNCFDYYNMGKDLGGIAPGKLADVLVFDDLKSFVPNTVFVGGKMVVSDKKLVAQIPNRVPRPWTKKTVRLGKILPIDFEVRSKKKTVHANVISMLTEIITKLGSAELETQNGSVHASTDKDIWKVAALDRMGGSGKKTIGFLENFGADIGAFASTWSFHENDLVVIGSNDSDMATACNELVRLHGGVIVVKDGKVLASMPLQFGGIVSTDPFEQVMQNFESVTSCIVDAGSKFARPHLIPLFLPFLALPSVRITHGGIIDVKKRSIVSSIT